MSSLSKQKDTIAIVNGVIVECYPAAHTDSIRGLDRVKLCWVDEGDMFGPSESRNIRGCVEGFLPKPNSENMYLILSSTPAKPMGLFETIEKEDPSIYYKMFLPYQYGLEGPSPIYTQEYIDEMRQKSPEFPREFELQYIGVVGNVFSQASIENCQKIEYNPMAIVPDAPKSWELIQLMGVPTLLLLSPNWLMERYRWLRLQNGQDLVSMKWLRRSGS